MLSSGMSPFHQMVTLPTGGLAPDEHPACVHAIRKDAPKSGLLPGALEAGRLFLPGLMKGIILSEEEGLFFSGINSAKLTRVGVGGSLGASSPCLQEKGIGGHSGARKQRSRHPHVHVRGEAGC